MFRFFIILISFSCLGLVAFLPGEPGNADRFPFLPETLRRVAKKVWDRCCVSRRASLCVRVNQSRTNQDQWHRLGFYSGDATPFAEPRSGRTPRRPPTHPSTHQGARGPPAPSHPLCFLVTSQIARRHVE